MSLFEWNDSYSVGVSEVDRQHKVLFDLINNLHDSMKKGEGNNVMGQILDELTDYTKNHFKYEEDRFARFGYELKDEHMRFHREFVSKVEGFQSDFKNNKGMLSMKVISFLRDWLLKHIKTEDPKYTELFNANGLH